MQLKHQDTKFRKKEYKISVSWCLRVLVEEKNKMKIKLNFKYLSAKISPICVHQRSIPL